MAKVKKKATLKKKIWVQLLAPAFFNQALLGEAYVFEAPEVLGKRVSANLSLLARDPKKQNINVTFVVTDIKENKGITRLMKYAVLPSSMKRLVRRNKSKVSDSFVAISAEGERLRVKPIITTRSRTNKSVETAIRMGMRAHIIKLLRKTKTDDFFSQVVQSKIQKESSGILKKIHPISICEIRSLELLKDEAKKQDVPTEEPQAPVETPEQAPEQPVEQAKA